MTSSRLPRPSDASRARAGHSRNSARRCATTLHKAPTPHSMVRSPPIASARWRRQTNYSCAAATGCVPRGRARIEIAIALEAGDQRRLGRGHASGGETIRHHGVGKPVEEMEGRETAVGETRQVDGLRREVEERRAKAEAAIALAASAGAGECGVFLLQHCYAQDPFHGDLARAWMPVLSSPVSAGAGAATMGECPICDANIAGSGHRRSPRADVGVFLGGGLPPKSLATAGDFPSPARRHERFMALPPTVPGGTP